jgi:hypothetical protein
MGKFREAEFREAEFRESTGCALSGRRDFSCGKAAEKARRSRRCRRPFARVRREFAAACVPTTKNGAAFRPRRTSE